MDSPAGGQRAPSAASRIPNLSTVVWRSLVGFRAMHLALALGIAAATAVIVGALVVGDSVRGSLKELVVERLGRIECALLAQRFFDPQILADSTRGIGHSDIHVEPLIVMPSVAVELRREGELHRAAQVQALGVDQTFWQAAADDPRLENVEIGADEVALNASLAAELDARVGDQVTLRFPKGTGVPADSPLGRRDDASADLPSQRVAAILPDHTVADLDFRAGQRATRNIFVPLAGLQDALEQTDKVNAALAVSPKAAEPVSLEKAQLLCDQLNERVRPSLADYGLKLTRHTRVFPDKEIGEEGEGDPQTIFDYFQFTSDQFIIDDASQDALIDALQPFQPHRSMSYLINEISTFDPDGGEGKTKVTYSIATGIENWEAISPNFSEAGSLWDQRPALCAVNSWLAERLDLHEGSILRIKHFRPETVDGREVEIDQELIVNQIVPVTAPSEEYRRNRPARFSSPPTVFNDPNMTPVVPGITDQDSISKWDLPFKLTREIPKEDDEYWQNYRLTPKIFLRYSVAARYFGSRFGSATAIRVDASKADEAQLRQRATEGMLKAKPGLGMQFQPIRKMQLLAASGTTPFDGLFLALSFFVIVAALMLVALLFRLSIEQRAGQWGLLMAAGFSHGRVRSLLLRESGVIIALGVLIGIALGLGYARLMVAGLETWWVGAISDAFLHFAFSTRSLLIGSAIGGLASLATILWSMWRLDKKQPLDLLRGRWEEPTATAGTQSKVALAIAGFLFFGAIGLLFLGATQTGMAQAGSFFGCGMLLLSAALVALAYMLKHRRPRGASADARPGLWTMAWFALTRNPWRSVLTIGLLAVASFLIASMSIFQIAPDLSGSGGFELMAESSLPLYRDIGSTRVREDVLSPKDFNTLRTTNILSFRARLGEDASCNNLYKVAQPTVLGVPDLLMQYQAATPKERQFQWAASHTKHELPWQELGQLAAGTADDPVPVVMDLNTAAWSLHQGASLDAITKIEFDDRVLYFRTVGLLQNSILQGKLLIGQHNFARLFPEINGYQFFLIHADNDLPAVSAALENGWSDQGLDASSTQEALAKLLAVQNTYISAFQSIGALGLLLGTVGLAVVQVRSVLERRRELALMQALGFSRARVSQQLLCEASVLLLGGLVIGIVAAAIAIVPYMLSSNPQLNLLEPFLLLSIVLVVGLAASMLAVVTALRQPIVPNLQ